MTGSGEACMRQMEEERRDPLIWNATGSGRGQLYLGQDPMPSLYHLGGVGVVVALNFMPAKYTHRVFRC